MHRFDSSVQSEDDSGPRQLQIIPTDALFLTRSPNKQPFVMLNGKPQHGSIKLISAVTNSRDKVISVYPSIYLTFQKRSSSSWSRTSSLFIDGNVKLYRPDLDGQEVKLRNDCEFSCSVADSRS